MNASKSPQSKLGLADFENFTVHDYLYAVSRRKWLVIGTALIIALATAIIAHMLPNQYRTSTVILVDPRKVPDNIVMSTVSGGVGDRLATLRQQILSSTRLEQIIDEMQLYASERKGWTQEELIDHMRKSISLDVVATLSGDRGLGAFRLTYQSTNPALAARVTNRLASLFIEQNIKEREQQVLGTSDFIDKEVEQAKKELEEKEDQIRQVKAKYASDLPESQNMHLQALTGLQLELRGELDTAGRIQQQIMYLQSMQQQNRPVVNLDSTGPEAAELVSARQQLSKIRGELRDMRQRYGPQHPEVLKREDDARKLQDDIVGLQKEAAKREAQAPPPPVPQAHNPVLESQLAALQQELQTHIQRQQEFKQQIAFHQGKLERIPIVEQQTASVLRDYQSAQDQYRHLLDRKFSADMSSDLESKQKGERFVVLDPAQVPEKPFSPNRVLIDAVGFGIGVLLGLAIAFLLELLDATVKNDRELRQYFEVTVLGELPYLSKVGRPVAPAKVIAAH